MWMYYIGIDLGTSAVKLLMTLKDGTIVGSVTKEYPLYFPHPGWSEDITKVAKFADLPENARKYVARISEIIGKPISMVSVGPSREQTITVE